ncbi:MAG: TIGR03086 family metal-binding protein [Nocardioides sp.]
MSTALQGAVELLDRSLGYTRVVLTGVADAHLDRSTPCRDWRLRDLLDHMDDSLDAFTEAAGGRVLLDQPPSDPAGARVERLQTKACALLCGWTAEDRETGVRIGDAALASDLLVAMAALEITVHGWDVARAIDSPADLPLDLAAALLDVALLVVGPADRGRRFAPPLPPSGFANGAAGDERDRLLAWLGRRPDWHRL